MGMMIKVDPRVLIPRLETALLVSKAAEILMKDTGTGNPMVLEIGTGSAAASLGLLKSIKDCRIIASDISQDALEVARQNVDRFDPDGKIKLVLSDMFDAFKERYKGKFNAIISNPPYVSEQDYQGLDAWVKAEPQEALCSGAEGMDCLRRIAAESGEFLSDGGFTAVEIGYDQSEKVKELFVRHGFADVTALKDFNGYERIIVGWKRG